jgi:hypothetical protein
MLDPAPAQRPVTVDENRRDIKHVAPAALHASFRSQQYPGTMIALVVPPEKRSDLMRLNGAWLASAVRSRLFQASGQKDDDGWQHFALGADQTFRRFLEARRFPFRNFKVRS